MANPITKAVKTARKAKAGAKAGAKRVVNQVKSNVAQGQKDFTSGKLSYYGKINHLKGVVQAAVGKKNGGITIR